MSNNTKKSKSVSRAPVDALQYEKLALSAHELCARQLGRLQRLARLAASIRRSPSLTMAERHSQQSLLELLVETAESYEREIECDLELFLVIALDAKGVPHRRITARCAANLLADAAKKTGEDAGAKSAATASRKILPRDVSSRGDAAAHASMSH
ncbi:hypothetical protein [Paraburkholderia xenovorans]|uniref:hypothetical protein n=1 Tax=Paraburkholderia xenovorans TaxID=36873 RepID=UPI0015C55146|nr:hypothetical protein [Paraburkholderia xenovorans]NPT34089.1 hypothetical protein [Paraburkholderia xenovorans]